MKAIVDCNSFYCSCERVFRPDLWHSPVVVLSNNDGCIVSRSDEAKKIGVGMAVPFFQQKELFAQHQVSTFSSNYNLYGDMSWRVMETLRSLLPEGYVEVYSVDEAFLDLSHIEPGQLQNFAAAVRRTVEQWTGIAVSIGVAPTKVLAKLANKIAKQHKKETACIMVLDSPEAIEQALIATRVGDIWGVGYRHAEKLRTLGIEDAWQLSRMNEEWVRKNLGGVIGQRLLRELNGIPSLEMDDELVEKKMIATTRMFGSAVTNLLDIKEAVATYVSRAAEKLRRQHSAASIISVFVVSKEKSAEALQKEQERKNSWHYSHGASHSLYEILPHATAATHELIKPAIRITEKLYKTGYRYKKAGIILSGLVPDDTIQGNLFVEKRENKNQVLMNMMDNINFSMRDDALKFASSGTSRDWKMRQEHRSDRFTTRWDELRLIS
ncbi:Y-family DNA polymerase [Deminuibacter soli]|uniref:Y-family DNA polymerase n=1 Tax=Deminuibacter soli TaxID=2291815 RepID=A0A3E1NPJ6_9BACT|nr:Y-family DNA polymerase [Deminuibacter soli]RFM29856.1 Y-family DNA polymerase [Deminuibacter soli]